MSQQRHRPTRPRRLELATAIGLALGLPASPVWAVGFGAGQIGSTLGQTLDFAVQMAGDGDETALGCLSAEVYAGDGRVDPHEVLAHLEPVGARPGATLRVRTTVPVDEPVVTVVLGAGCTARLSRRFVVFVDPPREHLAAATSVPEPLPTAAADGLRLASSPLQTVDAEGRTSDTAMPPSTTGPAPAAPTRASPPEPHRAALVATGDTAPAPVRSLVKRRSPPARPTRLAQAIVPRSTTASSANPPVAVSRLKLDAEPDFTPSAGATAASSPSEPSTAATLDTARYAALEAKLAKLEADSAAASANVDGLRRQLRAAAAASAAVSNGDAGHAGWPWQGLSAVLGLATVLLVWQRLRPVPRADWRDSTSPTADAVQPADDSAAVAMAPPTGPHEGADEAMRSRPDVAAPGAVADRPTAVDRAIAAWPAHDAAAAVTQVVLPPPSVEELIDLEQQFDFFSALGQDAHAIELMRSRLDTGSGAHPMPYLTLMDAYRRLGDEAAYRQLQTMFLTHFNAAAPDWDDVASTSGRAIEDYPEQLAELIGAWPTPADAAARLGGWIARDGSAANDDRFDMPAFRDMMFLHTLAREMTLRDSRAVVLQPLAFDLPATAQAAAPPGVEWTLPEFRFSAPTAAAPVAANVDIELDLPKVEIADEALELLLVGSGRIATH